MVEKPNIHVHKRLSFPWMNNRIGFGDHAWLFFLLIGFFLTIYSYFVALGERQSHALVRDF